MSLSFVSKSIQTSTDDGGYEETPVASSSDDAGGGANAMDRRPLFDQLRQNQERRDAEHEEFQRSVMRGTLALDEEDAAHLVALQRQRAVEETMRERQTADELAAFRAARADRRHDATTGCRGPVLGDGEGDEESSSPAKDAPPPAKRPIAPPTLPIVLKRKRRRDADGSSAPPSETQEEGKQPTSEASNGSEEGLAATTEASPTQQDSGPSQRPPRSPVDIGGLLAGYDSSSSDGE